MGHSIKFVCENTAECNNLMAIARKFGWQAVDVPQGVDYRVAVLTNQHYTFLHPNRGHYRHRMGRIFDGLGE